MEEKHQSVNETISHSDNTYLGQQIEIAVRVFFGEQIILSTVITEPVLLGRQDKSDSEPIGFAPQVGRGPKRLIIAELSERTVSRQHAIVSPNLDGTVRVKAERQIVVLDNGATLDPGSSCDLDMPTVIRLGSRDISLELTNVSFGLSSGSLNLKSLAIPTVAPSKTLLPTSDRFSNEALPEIDESVINLLQNALQFFHYVSSAENFFETALECVARIVDVDIAASLTYDGKSWTQDTSSRWVKPSSPINLNEWVPSRSVLQEVASQKRTFRLAPSDLDSTNPQSQKDAQAIVAAPILNSSGDVVGAIYGDQRFNKLGGEITEAQAMLVEMIACAVSNGLARIEQQRKASAAKLQFEQFVTPELAKRLDENPDLLKGRSTEVTILFCDVQGFSRISERAAPEETMGWINCILDELSQCVNNYQGHVVDYVGDELMAMWEDYDDNREHAKLACRAAIEMLTRLPVINQLWQDKMGEPTKVGIGINTGKARVGNTGSIFKFKYGPLGTTVNVASRVQGATKYLGSNLLITRATKDRLDNSFFSRRVSRISVVNIDQPVEIYDLSRSTSTNWISFKTEYEEGLKLYENKEFLDATRILSGLLARFPEDRSVLSLLSRTVSAMQADSDQFDGVFHLPGK